MNFQQLRTVREAVRRRFNLTEVADVLHSSQSAVSRQVSELEAELGVDLFLRTGRRLIGLTEAGEQLLPMIERLLQDADDIRRAGQDMQGREEGELTIASTRSQARYVIPKVISQFTRRYPRVAVHQLLGSAEQVAEFLLDGRATIGIAPERLGNYDQLVSFPSYTCGKVLVVPPEHPLLDQEHPLTLHDVGRHPIVTYDKTFSGRFEIEHAFAAVGAPLNIAMEAMSGEIVKAYVELHMGIGIIASVAWNDERDHHLRRIDAAHLFPSETIRIGWTRTRFLPGFAYAFIEAFDPQLTADRIKRSLLER